MPLPHKRRLLAATSRPTRPHATRRMAVTESNIAYRTADYERWQQMTFVVGIEIELSNNHTVKGGDGKPHAFYDICDELAGRYPKDFKFTGWHPHCRCHAVTIMKTDDELAVQKAGFDSGHAVILGSEKGIEIGKRYTEGTWDGIQFEVMGCETATDNNYLRGLCHCADKWTTEVAILHFPNGGFDKNKMRRAIGRYHGLEKLGDGQYLEFKSVVCILDGKVVYNEASKKGAGSSTFVVHPPHISKSRTAKVGNKPEPSKTEEQLLAEQREKQQLLTLERAKKRHDAHEGAGRGY